MHSAMAHMHAVAEQSMQHVSKLDEACDLPVSEAVSMQVRVAETTA